MDTKAATATKKSRPLNKKEQALFARLFCASLVHHTPLEWDASDKEYDGVVFAMDSIAERLAGGHSTRFSSSADITKYIKSLRPA